VLEHVGTPRRIGLVLPDPVAKVSVLRLAHVPDRDDLDEVIRWQMKKAAPFPLDEGQLSYVEGWRSPEGQDFVISLARREVVAEYESICASAGAHAGLVDTSTLNVVNALLAQGNTPSGDWMLIQIASGYASIVVLRGQNPIFFRSRADSETGSLSDLVHQTTMYYEDRLKGAGLGRVVVSGVGEAQASDVGEIRRTVESRLRMAVEAADLRPMVTLPDNVTPMPGAPGVPGIPGIVDALTPLVGLLVRDAG
jgi:Tfp pilus assembly PilM family ATPase